MRGHQVYHRLSKRTLDSWLCAYSGRLNNVCQFPGGSGICSNGACTFTKCSSGYFLVAGRCVRLDLQTDVNNWSVLRSEKQGAGA